MTSFVDCNFENSRKLIRDECNSEKHIIIK